MIKSPRLATAEQSHERVVLVDILEQQMLDLDALRKEVAAAESAAAAKKKHEPPQNGNASRSNGRARPSRRATSPAMRFPASG